MSTLTNFAFDHKQALIQKPCYIILLLKFSYSLVSNKIHIQPFTGVLWKRLFKTSDLTITFLGFSFLNNVDVWRPESYLKGDLSQMYFCEFQENNFYSTPPGECLFKHYGSLRTLFKCLCFQLLNIFAKHSILDVVGLIM